MAQITLNSSGVASNGSLLLQVNGTTTAVTVDTAGNMGLGVTPAAWALSGSTALQIRNAGFAGYLNNSYLSANQRFKSDGGSAYIATGFASLYAQGSGGHNWQIAASGTAGNDISFNQAMTLDASGNLGVGTTSPTYRLTVVGATSDATPVANFRGYTTGTDGARTAILRYSSSTDANWANARHDAYNHLWYGNGAEVARLTYDGNLLVGTTSLTSGGLSIQKEAAYGAWFTNADHPTGVPNAYPYAYFRYNGTIIGSITQSGTTAVSYNTTSDYRLKDNIEPLTGALARIAALKPCTYTWKSAPDEIGEGFIAHELAEVCPQAVSGEKNAVNEDGSIKPQGVDTSFLVATLTAAIQELKAIVDAQAVEIAALKGTA